MKRRFKVGLLLKIVIAIVLGLTFSTFLPTPGVRIFVTINSIFSNFLSFSIPLIIVGLVAPGIADLGSGAGKLLGITALVAYISTLFAGFFSYFTCLATFPYLLPGGRGTRGFSRRYRRRGSDQPVGIDHQCDDPSVFYDRHAAVYGRRFRIGLLFHFRLGVGRATGTYVQGCAQ